MNVLSLFDGMSCGQIALERVGIKVETYYASEIDKYAIEVAMKNYPSTVQLGDITKITESDLDKLPKIDMVIGGSPCQDFSTLKFNRKELRGNKSSLFYEYLRILNYLQKFNNKNVFFLLENVQMKKESKKELDEFMGVDGKLINSNIFSAQNRPRFYWTNIDTQIVSSENNVMVDDIILPIDIVEDKYFCKNHQIKHYNDCRYLNGHSDEIEVIDFYNKSIKYGKSNCLTPHASRCDRSATNIIKQEGRLRRFTPTECERLQTVPDGYTKNVSDTQRYKMLGNGWTVDVISHIFNGLNTN